MIIINFELLFLVITFRYFQLILDFRLYYHHLFRNYYLFQFLFKLFNVVIIQFPNLYLL